MLRIESPKPPWAPLLIVGVLPTLHMLWLLGRLHPDEVFQYLEPANFRAFGYGVLAWEWQPQGMLRNWAIPGLFAGLLKACAALGIDDPWKRRAVLAVPQLGLHLWMLWAAFRLAARRVPVEVAQWGIVLLGLYMPVISFAGRTLGESFSAAFLVIGLELLDRADARRSAVLGGVGLGLAVVARYGSAAAVIGAMGFLVARRRFRDFGFAAAGGVGVAAALGALDWATWGAPFQSLRAYLDFNVFSGRAAQQFGAEPFTLYLPFLGMLAPWAWPSLFKRPSGVFLAAAGAYLAAIFATPHKEPRFLYPALVLVSAAAVGPALELLKRRGAVAIFGAALLSLGFFAVDTPLRPARSDQFRLEARAWPAATGLILVGDGMWGSGGFFWLGKNLPWFPCDFPEQFLPALGDMRFNRVLVIDSRAEGELRAAGFTVLEQLGEARLWGR